MSNLLEKALMELSDGSREKMTDLTSITKRMTELASIITKRMTLASFLVLKSISISRI